MICARDVVKQYGTGERAFCALRGVSLTVEDGEFLAVVGRSGSGKSTLLHLLGSLDRATSGSVTIDGEELSALSRKQLAALRNHKLGFVFQSFYLEPEYTVRENIELPLLLGGFSERRERTERAMELVGVAEKAGSRAKNLSGGEQQRVAIARAIVCDPDYLFADEPCGNLDSANGERVMELFETLHAAGKTIVMVTHDMELARRADCVVTLSDGRLV